MIKVYLYDSDGNSNGYKEMSDSYQLSDGETLTKPDPTLHQPKFNGTTWTGITESEFKAQQLSSESNDNSQSISSLMQIVKTQSQEMESMKEQITALQDQLNK